MANMGLKGFKRNSGVSTPHEVTVANDGSKVSLDVGVADRTFRQATTGLYTYLGFASPGSLTASAAWKIMRITDSDSTILYADGDAEYDNVWDDRLTLSYA